MSKTYIANFSLSKDLSDIKYLFDNYRETNLDILLKDFITGKTVWSVPKNAVPGDIVIFMCAKTARDNLGLATSHIPADYGLEFQNFVGQQKALYKQYSGYLLGCGIVSSLPTYDSSENWWMADINNLTQFPNPVHIDDFRSFIFITRTGSFTDLNDDQWEHLKWVVNQKNPDFFHNVSAPDADVVNREFEDKVQKEQKKSLNQLKKEAEKKGNHPSSSTVQTKVYHRDPTIAAYVKKRAGGYCQLCEEKAPFDDQTGEPYLECHHIVWVSKGGMDSVDNCVALCPNCHRKMHILNDPNDVKKLIAKVSTNSK